MSRCFTRCALYDLVWSEPIQDLAPRCSLSDRGLAKICTAANIPVPTLGDGWGLFVGQLDDIRVYDRALSPAEIWRICQPAGGS
jgi:hypothetical protein